jgi:serine/threonine protein kinase
MAVVDETMLPVRSGDLIAGKYRIDRILGAGGMGVVVAATQLELDRPVALKFLLPMVLERWDFVARFSREARAAAKLHGEHLARVLDVGNLPGGEPFIVMEYLDGQDVAKVLAARGPLPASEAVDYLLQASEAVAEAHALGIIHRDLKPSNLFLAKRAGGPPTIKVLDFGLSKFTRAEKEDNVTTESSILGSPAYMSPEQLLSSRTVGVGTDIWSLGVVLYELLTAQRPFTAERMPEFVAAILQSSPRPIDMQATPVPPGLQEIVRRCLEKDPARRFANVAQLATALAAYSPPSAAPCIQRIVALLADGTPGSEHENAAASSGPTAPRGIEQRTESVDGSSKSVSRALRSGATRPTARRITRFALLSGFGAVASFAGVRWIVSSPPAHKAESPLGSGGDVRTANEVATEAAVRSPERPSPSSPAGPSASTASLPELAAAIDGGAPAESGVRTRKATKGAPAAPRPAASISAASASAAAPASATPPPQPPPGPTVADPLGRLKPL